MKTVWRVAYAASASSTARAGSPWSASNSGALEVGVEAGSGEELLVGPHEGEGVVGRRGVAGLQVELAEQRGRRGQRGPGGGVGDERDGRREVAPCGLDAGGTERRPDPLRGQREGAGEGRVGTVEIALRQEELTEELGERGGVGRVAGGGAGRLLHRGHGAREVAVELAKVGGPGQGGGAGPRSSISCT